MYLPLKAMKGKVIADFLANYVFERKKPLDQNYIDMDTWKLYFDCSCLAKGSGIDLMIVSPDGCPTKF